MKKEYETRIKPSYMQLRSIYLGADTLRDPNLRSGTVTVLLENDEEFSVEGTLNPQGYLSGMAKLYRHLKLQDGTVMVFSITDNGNIVVRAANAPQTGGEDKDLEPTLPPSVETTIFERKKLRHVHIEPFRPENLNNWEPETETDVYLAFGVLQEYTDFQYCCGASTTLLKKLGANYDDSAKPDAIVVDRTTGQYLMAEWKKHSSDYKGNHKPDDVDVLVCWHDNETDKSKLPRTVLELHSVAKTAASTVLLAEE
jgi:hypothetical protein